MICIHSKITLGFLKGIIISIFLLCSCSTDEEPKPVDETSFSCEMGSVDQKGDRKVGIDLLDLSESGTFDDNINYGKQLGADFIALHVAWTTIETSPNVLTDPDNALLLLGQAAAANNLKFSLTIRPIDLVGKTVPVDLTTLRFNEPQMTDRFTALIDFVLTKVEPSVLVNLQIGNEIDGYDTTNEPPTFWDDYGVFLNTVTNHVHATHPELKIGFTGTFSGLLDQSALFNDLVQNVDILGVTYYPLASNFDVLQPDTVFDHLGQLTSTFAGTPIYLQEVGYQSSPTNNSSDAKQAEFYCNFFKAWDTYKTQINTANIVRLNDLSATSALESARPYSISDNTFIEYLRTLGIRTYDDNGTEKQAFDVVQNNMKARGW